MRGLVLAVALLAGRFALAQDSGSATGAEGGLFARIDLSAGLSAQTGGDADDDTTARAGLAFGLDSATRSQSLRFRVGADLEFDRDGADLARPAASLDWTLASRATELGLNLRYSETDLDRARAEEIEEDDEILATDGRRTASVAEARLVTGREGPFGTETRLSWSRRDYAGTTDPDLVPVTTRSASTVLRFDIDPRVALRLTGSWLEREDEDADAVRKTTSRLGLGATFALDRAWTLAADVSATTIVTEAPSTLAPGLRARTTTEGFDAALDLQRALARGSLGLRLAREVETTGTRTSLVASRVLELPAGSLSGTLGAVRFEGGAVRPVATLAFSRDITGTQALSASLARTAAVNDDDEDVVRTRLSLGYRQEIDAVSGWSANFGLAEVEVVGGTGDQRRVDLGLGYRRALTADWDLNAGISHRLTWEDGTREDRTTTLTLNVARSFLFRP